MNDDEKEESSVCESCGSDNTESGLCLDCGWGWEGQIDHDRYDMER